MYTYSSRDRKKFKIILPWTFGRLRLTIFDVIKVSKVDTKPKQNKMPETPVQWRWNYILLSENIIYVYLKIVYGKIARLIFSQIYQGAFSKRQLKYSLDLKQLLSTFYFLCIYLFKTENMLKNGNVNQHLITLLIVCIIDKRQYINSLSRSWKGYSNIKHQAKISRSQCQVSTSYS